MVARDRVLLALVPAVWLALAPAVAGADGGRGISPAAAEALERHRLEILSSAAHDHRGSVAALRWGPREPQPPSPPARLDVHAAVAGHARQACARCHAEQARNLHTTRGNITCQQCHGGHPIASADHYFAPMNTIRRHAYVCARCHQGASASFATYVLHPAAGAALRERFPALYWADRFMFALIVGVMALFVAHAAAWWLREWFVRRGSPS